MNTFEVNLRAKSKRKGFLIESIFPQDSEQKAVQDLQKIIEETCSPEHLLLASINSCLMASFLTAIENSTIQIISFESSSSCTIGVIKGKDTITEIILRPKVVIPYFQNPERARYILEKSKNSCLILNSVKPNIRLDPEVIIELILISKEYKDDFREK
ncbi:OsmC family protein [Flavobacterium sp. W22_SRS_FP1]|uniref:OsmC family protein n=1 Tax=Flavobacterium sp. W22_SRS_FP1 TaxID=3240276 RepID=UPI003F8FF3E3